MYNEEMAIEIEDAMKRVAKYLGFDFRGASAEVNQVSFSKTVIYIDLDVIINNNYISIEATDNGKYWKGSVELRGPSGQGKTGKNFKKKSEASVDAEDLVYSILESIKESEEITATYNLNYVSSK